MKKVISVFLALTLVLSSVFVGNSTSFAANELYYEGFKYVVNDDSKITITDYIGSAKDITVPSQINGNTVARIGNEAFYNKNSLTSVKLPDTITSIGSEAFYNCYNLTTVNIPYGVTTILTATFEYCSSLTNITIPNSVESLSYRAFSNCSSLKSIKLPSSVTYLENYAFRGCSSLTSVEIPNSVTYMGMYAFRDCTSLTSIELPASIDHIKSSTFSGCTSLKDVKILCNTEDFVIDSTAFYNCNSLINLKLPETTTKIGSSAFESCDNLRIVEIPNSNTEVYYNAFDYCPDLTIYGIKNSIVEGYAVQNGVRFKELGTKTDVSPLEITTGFTSYEYTGSQVKPSITVKEGDLVLIENLDYTVSYGSNIGPGKGTITINGINYYTGTKTIQFDINKTSINVSSLSVTTNSTNYTYTGSQIKPSITVKDGNTVLKEGVDYSVSYGANIYPGKGTITINGLNNYTGTKTIQFDIVSAKVDISSLDIFLDQINYDYTGYQIRPIVTILEEDYSELEEGVDFTVSYGTNISIGQGTVTVTGINDYTGSKTLKFDIIEPSTLDLYNYNYPTTITEGDSFKLSGTIKSNYLIDYVVVGVFDEDGYAVPSAFKEVYPYTYSYSDIDSGIKFGTLPAGNYTYQIFASDESGTMELLLSKDFTVKKPSVKISNISGLKFSSTTSTTTLSWNKASYASGYEVWMYKSSLGGYTKVKTITSRSTTSYKRSSLTSATMYRYKVRAYRIVNGKKYYGNFSSEYMTGTKPLTPSITLSSTQKGKIKITWKNTSKKTTGYQIYRATSRYGTYTRIATVEDGNIARSYTNSGRKSGKTYYYKVRAYRTLDNGKKVYSSYSSVKYKKAK